MFENAKNQNYQNAENKSPTNLVAYGECLLLIDFDQFI